jgi:hypothetical protein
MTAPIPATAADLAAAREAEYGQYVALQPIDIGGARAFNAGDAVPVSHVEGGVVRADQVAKTSTKAGREAAGITDENKKG